MPRRLKLTQGHRDDLRFLAELRSADLDRLRQIALNLSFGGPAWQQIAVARTLRLLSTSPPSPR